MKPTPPIFGRHSCLAKPHYIYRPSQLVRRARLPRAAAEAVVETPWHCPLQVMLGDAMGAGIARMGVHELGVSETIWRLAGGDQLALDVGANVGYFTGLLACRAAHVVALEPNPHLSRLLSGNVGRWGSLVSRIELDLRAASDRSGSATLYIPSGYESNSGIASLEDPGASEAHDVATVRLDDVIAGRHVGVMKLDVEGHETTALTGASESLAGGLIRDITFEEHQPLPSPTSELLEAAGFTIWGIEETLTRPLLIAPDREPRGWDAPTYLASIDPERAMRLMAGRGWRCLRARGTPASQSVRGARDHR